MYRALCISLLERVESKTKVIYVENTMDTFLTAKLNAGYTLYYDQKNQNEIS